MMVIYWWTGRRRLCPRKSTCEHEPGKTGPRPRRRCNSESAYGPRSLGRRTQAHVPRPRPRTATWVPVHMVSRRPDARHIHNSIDHWPFVDALLPSFHSAGVRGYEKSAVCCVVRIFSQKSASLVGAGNGPAGVYSHGQSVLSRSISTAARIELGRRLHSSAAHPAAELYRLSAAVGPDLLLGRYRGLKHHGLGSRHRRKNALRSARGKHSQRECASPFLCFAHGNFAAIGDCFDLHSHVAPAPGWRDVFAGFRGIGKIRIVMMKKTLSEDEGGLPSRMPGEKRISYGELLFREMIAIEIMAVVLVCVALVRNAPLEQLADPLHTANPAKAPWYFTGLQELLHYSPPFVAGVILPTLLVLALIVVPFFNVNIKNETLWAKNKSQRLAGLAVIPVLLAALLLRVGAWGGAVPALIVSALMALAASCSG